MNLANKLTIVRIILVPIFMLFVLLKIPYGDFIAAGVFGLAAATDSLDGYIARKRKEVTKFGKFIDPLADKLLVTAALLSLVELGRLGAWVAMIIIGREFAVTGLRVIAASEGIVIAASKLGKLKTVFQIMAIMAILVQDYPFRLLEIPVGSITLVAAVFFTILSGADYFIKARNLIIARN
ncbi:MAG TPA: CDP-diacylglycerol--glycerol-3-phosphate 3-phosphatidyltransferase [Firmicutes bacterium]|nr:CDP-diacylglycerol--glycerol-3-phosphate 3-phosphatidyltransferase [Bacillota bacterium]